MPKAKSSKSGKKSSKSILSRLSTRRSQALMVVALFAATGGILVFRSFAATEGQLAYFDKQFRLHTVWADGTHDRIRPAAAPSSSPTSKVSLSGDIPLSWSYDHTKLAYVGYDFNNPQCASTITHCAVLIVFNTSQGKATILVPLNRFHDIRRPVWQPNSNKILFWGSLTSTDSGDLYTINDDGTGLKKVTTLTSMDRGTVDNNFQWSPDGKSIVYEEQTAQLGQWYNSLYMMNADGSNLQDLRDLLGSDVSTMSEHALSSDGSHLVFTERLYDSNGNFYSVMYNMDLHSSGFTMTDIRAPILRGDDFFDATFSPSDNTRVLYMMVHNSSPDVRQSISVETIKTDGTNHTHAALTTNTSSADGYAQWSPAGDRVLVNLHEGTNVAPSMWIQQPNGQNRVKIAAGNAYNGRWRP